MAERMVSRAAEVVQTYGGFSFTSWHQSGGRCEVHKPAHRIEGGWDLSPIPNHARNGFSRNFRTVHNAAIGGNEPAAMSGVFPSTGDAIRWTNGRRRQENSSATEAIGTRDAQHLSEAPEKWWQHMNLRIFSGQPGRHPVLAAISANSVDTRRVGNVTLTRFECKHYKPPSPHRP